MSQKHFVVVFKRILLGGLLMSMGLSLISCTNEEPADSSSGGSVPVSDTSSNPSSDTFSLTAAALEAAHWSSAWRAYGHYGENGTLRLGTGQDGGYALGAYQDHAAFFNKFLEMDMLFELTGPVDLLMRAKANSGLGETNPCYVITFEDASEMTLRVSRYNKGEATDLTGTISIEDSYRPYEYNRYKMGFFNEGSTVRILLYVNDVLVVDTVDASPSEQNLKDGYLFFQGGLSMITLRGTDTDVPSSAKAPVETGEYQGIKLYDISGLTDYTLRDLRTILQPDTFTSTEGVTLPYRVYLPTNYSPDKVYPLYLHLHGGGLRGTDNLLQITGDCKQTTALLDYQKTEEYILLLPQCPPDVFWTSGLRYADDRYWFSLSEDKESGLLRALGELLEAATAEFSVDTKRLYLSGFSMGGMGSYDLLNRFPNRFAAAMVGCALSDVSKIDNLKKTPMYLLHGASDATIPVEGSRNMAAALKKAGADYVYVELPGRDHDLLSARGEEMTEALRWMFAKRR